MTVPETLAWCLVTFLFGVLITAGVAGRIGWNWLHPKPPKVVVQPAPVTVVSKADPQLHQATKPQPVVKSA